MSENIFPLEVFDFCVLLSSIMSMRTLWEKSETELNSQSLSASQSDVKMFIHQLISFFLSLNSLLNAIFNTFILYVVILKYIDMGSSFWTLYEMPEWAVHVCTRRYKGVFMKQGPTHVFTCRVIRVRFFKNVLEKR